MSKLTRIILGIASLAVPTFLAYYLNHGVSDIRYSLSQPIPLGGSMGTNGVPMRVQQLSVINNGDIEAERIVIKIYGPVDSCNIEQYSAEDTVKVDVKSQPCEIDYPKLPPLARFSATLKSESSIDTAQVRVSHSKGQGREVLSGSGTSWASIFQAFYLGGFIVFLCFTWSSARKSAMALWTTKQTNGLRLDQLATVSPPWYFPEKWKLQIPTVLFSDVLAKTDYLGTTISEMHSYQFLKLEKPERCSEADWEDLAKRAILRLSDVLKKRINYAHRTADLVTLFSLQRPNHFPATTWSELIKNAEDQYIAIEWRNHAHVGGGALGLLKQPKPVGVPERLLDEVTDILQERYYSYILSQIHYSSDTFVREVKHADLSVLTEDQKGTLSSMFRRAEEIVQEARKNKETDDCFFHVLNGTPLTEKPKHIDEFTWRTFKTYEGLAEKVRNVEAAERQLEMRRSQFLAEECEFSAKKNKIERQLKLIHEVLTDPTAADRIEELDGTFAPGNLANLKKVAAILRNVGE